MAKKTKTAGPKVTAAQMKKIVEFHKKDKTTISLPIADGQVDIVVSPHLSVAERAVVVNTITGACFDDKMVYHPEMYFDVFKASIVHAYTNISDSVDIDVLSDVLAYTNVYEMILDNIVDDVGEIDADVGNKVTYINAKLSENHKFDELIDAVVEVAHHVDSTLTAAASSMSEDDKQISISDIVNAAKTIGKKDETTMVNAILEYQKSKLENANQSGKIVAFKKPE